MTDPQAGGDLTDAALDQWVADADAKAEKYKALSVGIALVAVTETSPDGLITVTVNSTGLLTELRISERATGMPGPRTAAAVMATMRRAQSRVVDRVAEVMRTTIGDDTAMVDTVLADYHGRFAPPVTPARPQAVEEIRIDAQPQPAVVRHAPVPRPVGGRTPEDGWDDGGSVLEEVDR
jgi:hypothetical protein